VLPLCMSFPSSHFLSSFPHHNPSSSSASYRRERLALTTSGLATLGTNISTNSIATSNDFAFLFPKYLNIKRGAFITSILGGWVTCPWQIQKSAQSLTTFLSGYVIVLAPLLAIMVSLFLLFLLPSTFFPLLFPSPPPPFSII
jgi:cytosine/uracil/thiamine/allantoin permease